MPDTVINDEQLLTGAAIFLLVHSINKEAPNAKRSRKYLRMTVKRYLAIYLSNHNPERYNKLMYGAADIIHRVLETMRSEKKITGEIRITPSGLIRGLQKHRNDLVDVFNLDERHLVEMDKVYADSHLLFPSFSFVTRMLKEIESFLVIFNNELTPELCVTR